MALIWLMIGSLVLLLLPNKLHSQSDTTVFDFTGFEARDPNLVLQGEAHVGGGQVLTLTRSFRNSVGRALYSPPIRLWDSAGRRQANFQTIFTGLIWGFNEPYGISFFVAPVNANIPTASTAGGNMGLYDTSSGTSPVPLFAVELDYAIDSWDPNYRHVGININSRNSVEVERLDSGTTSFNNVEARITYDARQRSISVFANASGPMEPVIARVEHTFDLKTLLPEWVQIGFSASTGPARTAIHEIRTWSFISFMMPDHDDVNQRDEDKHKYIRQFV